MDNKENNDVSKEVVKRKTNWGFTLFACVATGVIVFLAMNLGNKASKIVDPDTNTKSSNEVSDSNSNSNEASNSNSNSNIDSNVNSNLNSNTSSNVTSNQPVSNATSNTTKTIASIAGKYVGDHPSDNSADESAYELFALTINTNGTCEYRRGVTNIGDTIYRGKCTLNGNTITLNYTEEESREEKMAATGTEIFTLNSNNTINYNETPGLGNVTLKKTK